MKTVVFAIILSALTTPLEAQWVHRPTAGHPAHPGREAQSDRASSADR